MGLLSGTAITADAGRRTEDGSDRTVALNASFMYLGFSLGAMLGSLVLMHAAVTTLGLVGAV